MMPRSLWRLVNRSRFLKVANSVI